MYIRVRPRFFDQVGHETMYAFSISLSNYEERPRTSQNLYFQSHLSVLKIGQIFPQKKF